MNNQATVDLTGAGNATTQVQAGRGNNSSVSIAGGQNSVTTIQANNDSRDPAGRTGQSSPQFSGRKQPFLWAPANWQRQDGDGSAVWGV